MISTVKFRHYNQNISKNKLNKYQKIGTKQKSRTKLQKNHMSGGFVFYIKSNNFLQYLFFNLFDFNQKQRFCSFVSQLYMASRSRFNNILKEQSINIRACLYAQNYYFGYENMQNFDGANTINFWQARQNMSFPNMLSNAKESEFDIQIFDGMGPDKKKGLKFLTWILYRLIRKKKYDIHELANTCIDYVVQKQSSNNNYDKDVQNVRRRIYDAINVMTSIGLVVKNRSFQIHIKQPQPFSLMGFNHKKLKNQSQGQGVHDSTNQNYKKEIKIKMQSIEQKRLYIEMMKSRIKTLNKHIQRNKILNLSKNKVNLLQNKCLPFPIIFLGLDKKQTNKLDFSNPKQIIIKHNKNYLVFLTDLEALTLLDEQQNIKQQPNAQPQISYFWNQQNRMIKQQQRSPQNVKLHNSYKINQQRCKQQIKSQNHTKSKSLLKISKEQQQNQLVKQIKLHVSKQAFNLHNPMQQ